MDVEKLLKNPRFRWDVRGAPDPAALEEFRDLAPPNLPRTYLSFLSSCNGASGDVPYDSGHIRVWSVEDAKRENDELGVSSRLPGYFAFASDGDDHLFAFDLRAGDGAAVVSVPAKSMESDDVEVLTTSFSEFLAHAVNMGVHG